MEKHENQTPIDYSVPEMGKSIHRFRIQSLQSGQFIVLVSRFDYVLIYWKIVTSVHDYIFNVFLGESVGIIFIFHSHPTIIHLNCKKYAWLDLTCIYSRNQVKSWPMKKCLQVTRYQRKSSSQVSRSNMHDHISPWTYTESVTVGLGQSKMTWLPHLWLALLSVCVNLSFFCSRKKRWLL